LYTEVATTFLSQPLAATNSFDFYLSQLKQLEQVLFQLPPAVAEGTPGCAAPLCGANYTSQLSAQLSSCFAAASLSMLCQSTTFEPVFDYVVRLFGYTFFVCLAAQIFLLVLHAVWKDKSTMSDVKLWPNSAAHHDHAVAL
jgi:hypothetical protein